MGAGIKVTSHRSAWLEFKDVTSKIKHTSLSGGFQAVYKEEKQAELHAAAAQRRAYLRTNVEVAAPAVQEMQTVPRGGEELQGTQGAGCSPELNKTCTP